MSKQAFRTLALLASTMLPPAAVGWAAGPYDAAQDPYQAVDSRVYPDDPRYRQPPPNVRPPRQAMNHNMAPSSQVMYYKGPPQQAMNRNAAPPSKARPSQRTLYNRQLAEQQARRNPDPYQRPERRGAARNPQRPNDDRYDERYDAPQVRRTNWQDEPAPEMFNEPEPTFAPPPSAGGDREQMPVPTQPRARSAPPRSVAPSEPVYSPRSGQPSQDGYFVEGGTPYTPYDNDYDYSFGSDCGDCGQCGPCRGPLYVRGEYLLWWLTGDTLPPLVTTSTAGTLQPAAGVLGQPATSILFGDQVVNNQGRSGARLTAGWWYSPTARLEGDVFGLGGQKATFDQTSNGDTILARPFFNLATGAQGSQLLAFPNTFAGQISIAETSYFNGAGAHILHSVRYDNTKFGFMRRVDLLYGFRYLGLYDNLTINGTATTINPLLPTTTLATFDGFKTSNSFFGANIGASMESTRGSWSLLATGRLGIGGTAQRVTISGNSTATASGSSTTSQGGLLAMPTNIGTYSHGAFSLVPHLELKLAYNFSPAWRFTFGYDILYWSNVVRPGQQIDMFVNPSQAGGQPLSGTIGPLFGFQQSYLWAQGISIGGEYRF